jgi:hypothetical protein
MADIEALELDALWEEFQGVVNVTSLELGQWLSTAAAPGEEQETGEQVLAILRKRRSELTDEDIRVMYDVVEKGRLL